MAIILAKQLLLCEHAEDLMKNLRSCLQNTQAPITSTKRDRDNYQGLVQVARTIASPRVVSLTETTKNPPYVNEMRSKPESRQSIFHGHPSNACHALTNGK